MVDRGTDLVDRTGQRLVIDPVLLTTSVEHCLSQELGGLGPLVHTSDLPVEVVNPDAGAICLVLQLLTPHPRELTPQRRLAGLLLRQSCTHIGQPILRVGHVLGDLVGMAILKVLPGPIQCLGSLRVGCSCFFLLDPDVVVTCLLTSQVELLGEFGASGLVTGHRRRCRDHALAGLIQALPDCAELSLQLSHLILRCGQLGFRRLYLGVRIGKIGVRGLAVGSGR